MGNNTKQTLPIFIQKSMGEGGFEGNKFLKTGKCFPPKETKIMEKEELIYLFKSME
jgi:hypothetical protein